MESRAVSIRIGARTRRLRRRRLTSIPSMRGSITSRRITSYAVERAASSASSPSRTTSVARPASSSPRRTLAANRRSSSASRTLNAAPPPEVSRLRACESYLEANERLGLVVRAGVRQPDGEHGAPAGCLGEPHLAALYAREGRAQRQAQARPAFGHPAAHA